MNNKVTIDLVTHDSQRGVWILTLVEQGPWPEIAIENEIRRLQDRLFGSLDLVLNGLLAQKYPECVNAIVVIRLHCYDTPEKLCADLFEAYTAHARTSSEIAQAIHDSRYVKSFAFEFSWRTLAEKAD